MKKTFYRVANSDTEQGLWYTFKGEFTGLIHSEFNFCMNTSLPMPFDKSIVGWLSATETLEELFNWFSRDDIKRLEGHGYFITIYESSEYRYHENHWLIDQSSSILLSRLLIDNR